MSKIKVILVREEESFDLHANSLKEVLSLLQLQKGAEYVSNLVAEEYKYILVNGEDYENMVSLSPEIATSSFDGFDTLLIVPEIEGEEPFMIAAVIILGTNASTAAVIATAAVLAIATSIAVSMAVSAIMSALSPTPEFSRDPAKQQESNLFNSAPLVRNQGGSVPLIFGNPYCGAVLISSGLFSEEVTV